MNFPRVRAFAARALLSAAWAGLIPAGALAATPGGSIPALTQYKIDNWQTEQGLPSNTVQSLYQTRDGYLWVGTGGGLARFDGVRFAPFERSQAPELAAQPVFGFLEDAQQNLWIGHASGASIYRGGKFKPAITSEVTGNRRVWAFAQGADGVMWAASENGLVRVQNGATQVFKTADGLPTNRLRALAFDRDGTLWIATTGGGLVAYAEGKFRTFDPGNGFPHREVRSVVADPQGGVWAATAGGGLARVHEGKVTVYTTADGLPTDQLTYLAWDAQGCLWIGTWGGGVGRMAGGRFTSISTAGGLAGSQIWTLRVDREGSVWVGTWVGGMSRLRDRSFVVFGTPEGLSHDNVRSVVHARDGATWLATAGGGLNRLAGDRVTVLGRKEGLPSEEVSSVYEDRAGTLWVGTYTGGVARIAAGKVRTYGVAQGLPTVDVRTLYEDSKGTLWAGTRAGLARFDGQGFVTVRDPGAPPEGVTAILEDRHGTLWFGTTGQGLVRYRDGRFGAITKAEGLVSNWIMALHEDASGSLWVGTNGQGINRIRNGRVAGIRPADGLWDGLAQTILEDSRGDLWMTCDRGFFRVARRELDDFADGKIAKVTSTGFGPGDALRATSFAGGIQPAGAVDREGRLWLPSTNGLVIVDPKRLPGAGQPPTVRIESVVVAGASAATDGRIELPPGSVPLSIRFAAMTLRDANRVRFRYKLDGMTNDWIDAGQNREATFPALPHGRYLFQVAATLDGERWSALEAPLGITVRPRFYETAWFEVLAGLAALALVLGLYRLRTNNLRARNEEMERLVAQRTEELRLANEHLSRLSFADALTGLANRRRFDEVLVEEWRRARRTQASLAVAMIDIDAFKQYNDSAGHPEGDRCLALVARRLVQSLGRAGDLAARYGGEEFVVLLPGADHAAALAFAEELRRGCEELAIPHLSSPIGAVVTISVGVAACVPSDEDSVAGLIARADAALYRAKQDGRNCVR
ncbi:MAG: diguanylate cyclase [Betaproteobacteria bacterium]|nr:diguanylate cyclase [Betaproteobacteria bacterium]